MIKNKIIEASLLAFSKNYFKFWMQIKSLKKNGIDHIHYDVMDNKFVPNTAFNGEKLKYLKRKGFKISVHLMVYDVESYINKFLQYDIDILTFHCEAIEKDQINKYLKIIKEKKIMNGIALKPETKINDYKEFILNSDVITVMGVNPGFGGQKYIESTTPKLNELKKLVNNKNILIQLDGGVTTEIIEKVKPYVDLFISGSFLMKSKNKKEIVEKLI